MAGGHFGNVCVARSVFAKDDRLNKYIVCGGRENIGFND